MQMSFYIVEKVCLWHLQDFLLLLETSKEFRIEIQEGGNTPLTDFIALHHT